MAGVIVIFLLCEYRHMTDIHQILHSLRGHVTSLTFATAKVKSITNSTPQVGFVGYIALTLVASRYGSGVHQWDVRLRDFMTWAKVKLSKSTMIIN